MSAGSSYSTIGYYTDIVSIKERYREIKSDRDIKRGTVKEEWGGYKDIIMVVSWVATTQPLDIILI